PCAVRPEFLQSRDDLTGGPRSLSRRACPKGRPAPRRGSAGPAVARRGSRGRKPNSLASTSQRSILIAMARKGKTRTRPTSSALGGGRKKVLVVLFVPSVERDGATPIDQDFWVNSALELLGRILGAATAYPRARGIR